MPRKELTAEFNERFGTYVSEKAIRNQCNRLGIRGQETRFQKGVAVHEKAPIGYERLNSQGYVEVKTSDGWQLKQRGIWEGENGAIPEGHIIAFRDGDKENFDIDNLFIMSRQESLYINRMGLSGMPPEMVDTALLIAKVSLKRSELERNNDE